MWNCCASGAIFSLTRMQLTIFKKSFFLMVLFGLCGAIGIFSAVFHIITQAAITLCYPCQVQVQVNHKPCCPCPMHSQGMDLGWYRVYYLHLSKPLNAVFKLKEWTWVGARHFLFFSLCTCICVLVLWNRVFMFFLLSFCICISMQFSSSSSGPGLVPATQS